MHFRKYRKELFLGLLLASAIWLLPAPASADAVELSGGGSYSKSNYGNGNYTWNRRWGLSMGYHLSERVQLEIGIQDIIDRTMITGFEDTTFHDQIYSVNLLLSFAGKKSAIQPYVKAGVGQLNREATGTYAFGGSPAALVDQVTGIIGAGLKIYLTRTFGIRAEGTSYLSGGSIGTWQDNFSVTTGVSIYF